MSILPTDDAIARFKANEERVDIFVNDPLSTGYYTTNETVPRQVKTLPELADEIAASIALRADLASDTTGKGDALVATKQPFSGAIARTQHDKNQEWVSVLDFGADPTGATACHDNLQMAIDSNKSVFFPKGTYLIASPIVVKNGSRLVGEGIDNSIIKKATDVEIISNDPLQEIWGVIIENIGFVSTVTTATTKYDIHISNPNACVIRNVLVKSGHNDSHLSSSDVGGIWLDNSKGGSSYMNLVENCWMQNNSIYCKGITDSTIRGGFYWGHTRSFAIGFLGGGANSVEHVSGIICSLYNGGIYLMGGSINQMRIVNNEFDGNPALQTGIGIKSVEYSTSVVISNNMFWGCDTDAINTTDPHNWSITGNVFLNNNASDLYYDDIKIIGKTLTPSGNVVSGNVHSITTARTNKGHAIREVDAGNIPIHNSYSCNGFNGNYASPVYSLKPYATVIGNTGANAHLATKIPDRLGESSLALSTTSNLNINEYIDIVVGSAKFQGTLNISSVRLNYTDQSRSAVYALAVSGTSLVNNELALITGSGGGANFTVSIPSIGVIRITNTFSSLMLVTASFFGHKGI